MELRVYGPQISPKALVFLRLFPQGSGNIRLEVVTIDGKRLTDSGILDITTSGKIRVLKGFSPDLGFALNIDGQVTLEP